VYVDDCIIISDSRLKIQHLVHSLSTGPEEFILTQEGTLDKFLGIDIKGLGTESYELSQPFLIERLINFVEDESTSTRGIVYTPKPELGLECFVDADFAGGWTQADADNPDNVLSRTGYVIRYAGCPIGWCSKLQSEIALSTAEAEYIALSQALREVIPLITLLD
jgi:hypothetical protein